MRTPDRETALLAARLTAAALADAATRSAHVRDIGVHDRAPAAAAAALSHTIESLWRRGWAPTDVVGATPRPLSGLATDAIAAQCAGYGRVHPRWRDQLAEIDATVWWTGAHLPAWATRKRLPMADALARVIDLLAVLLALPPLPELVPPPDAVVAMEPTGRVDERVLAKVRGLLAKAESTPFPEEAEALSAKAQELMTRYAFEQAAVDEVPQEAGAARLWIEAPYQGPKAQLVDAVAGANRCRAVFYPKLGCVVLVGHSTDIELATLLSRSLHVQATHALAGSGSKAYRHAFLVAYAQRIRERLTVVNQVSVDTRLVPVFTRREAAVRTRFEAMFPGVRTRHSSVSNAAGWSAGRAAADRADLVPQRVRVAAG
ncbi:hypothetical protein [Alloactinosynnema sp. L-07]|uniref:DUF2786 domain-containing protein n=1 Tax=Alloactinosynnema sp. L-07 TaxID=1653480 RepID=UPI00065EFDA0|nr:DUF2786 domain-containing protein [Alloactinosynnema sp. L-07]CRK60978.1 hypothetical protein [Alloactinosynnema sp. L-07]